jgi:hypothetical protein
VFLIVLGIVDEQNEKNVHCFYSPEQELPVCDSILRLLSLSFR